MNTVEIACLFLDSEISLNSEKFESSVYRKKTNTNVILHYDAVAPKAWKTGLAKCFLHRAKVICSNEKTLHKELDTLKDIYFRNGYPMKFMDNVIKKVFEPKENHTVIEKSAPVNNTNAEEEAKCSKNEFKSILKIPFIGKISAVFGRRMKQVIKSLGQDIKIVYQTTKIKDSFQLKDPVPKHLQAAIVYEFSCRGDPDTKYIGFTNRTLHERVKEHVRGGTAVSDHIANCKECDQKGVTINDFKILKRCRNKYDTSKYEALYIKEKDPALNRQLIKPGGKQYTLAVFG